MANNPSSQSNRVDLDDYDADDAVAFGTVIHKIGKVKTAIHNMSRSGKSLDSYLCTEFKNSLGTSNYWVDPGTECEILKIGSKGWKKGKVKLRVVMEFYPDEPEVEEVLTSNKQEVNQAEPSLDDIRLSLGKFRQ